jgi:hypothetical protein
MNYVEEICTLSESILQRRDRTNIETLTDIDNIIFSVKGYL